MPTVRKIWIHTIAIAPFFFFKEQVERHIGLPLCLIVALIVALSARYLAERVGSEQLLDTEPLSIGDARRLVESLANDPARIKAVLATPGQHIPETLGTATKESFRMYSEVSSIDDSLVLDVATIQKSNYVAEFWSLGHCEDWDVVQRPGSDEVFVIEGALCDHEDMEVRFPSVYHLIMNEAEAD
jgi:hypothetical protein